MSEQTKIQWTDHTVNFVIGCTKVDELCANCYADALDQTRFSKTLPGTSKAAPVRHWGPNAPRYLRIDEASKDLIRFNRKARREGRIAKVFINSLSDTFEGREDLNQARAALFAMIGACENLIFQLLTKRPENVNKMVPEKWLTDWPRNVWMGASYSPERMEHLLKIPARVRFLSVEPMLSAVDLQILDEMCHCGESRNGYHDNHNYTPMVSGPPLEIHWTIIGGESGSHARPFNIQWARSIIAQCKAASVACFVKQLGAFPICDNANDFEWPDDAQLVASGEGFASCRAILKDKKGGTITEWPEELRIREFPNVKS